MRRLLIISFLAYFSLILLPQSAGAQWVEDGIPITTGSITGTNSEMMPDGEGGFFVVFTDGSYSSSNVWAQRIDRHGNLLWGQDGVIVCDEPEYQSYAAMCSDGAGGMIVFFIDERYGNKDIFAQRIDPDGNPVWAKSGQAVCTQTNDQSSVRVVADGEGGAYVSWLDSRNGNNDIFVQRINFLGSRQFAIEGLSVCTQTDNQGNLQMVPAQSPYGVWIGFTDYRSGPMDSNVYLLRLWSSGGINYDESYSTGVPVCTEANNQDDLVMLADGEGGVVMVWEDSRTGGWDIYGQHMRDSWNYSWGYTGTGICTEATGSQINPDIAMGSDGFVLVTWRDSRSLTNEIYSQKVGRFGDLMWATDGAVVCNIPGEHLSPMVVSDGAGGMIVTWLDRRTFGDNIFAQRLSSSGTRQWEYDGVPVCDVTGYQSPRDMIVDGEGGAFFLYSDGRDPSNYNSYAQHIERNGYWGYPAPTITSAEDIPGDQGGYVHISFEGSRLDLYPEEEIDYYTIWRAIEPVTAMRMIEDGAKLVDDPAMLFTEQSEEAGRELVGIVAPDITIRRQILGASTHYWELIEGTVPACHLETYGYTAETLFDYTMVSPGYHYFQVIAVANYGAQYWISEPDSGWSVDNLAPEQPQNVIGLPEYGPPAVTIEWDPNTEEDLFGYRIYRSDVPQFIPDANTLIGATTDPTINDEYPMWGSAYYMISAVDIHGNESPYAELGPGIITGDDLPDAPEASFLAQNYPNPFNPSTTISFGLKTAGPVSLKIYDPAGRLVRILVEEQRTASVYNEIWDGLDDGGSRVSSGVYFYRLIADSFEKTKKMVLLR